MRFVKMFLFVLTGLLVMFTLFGLVMPSSAKLARGVIIQADSATVYKELSDVKDWNKWLPWIVADSGAIVQLSPVTNEPGSYFKWKGLCFKSGGTLTLKSFSNQEIKVLHQLQDMNDSEGGFRIRSVGTSGRETEVQWFLEYKLKWYPWERFYGIFLDHIISPALDKGLNNLKEYIEQKQHPVAS